MRCGRHGASTATVNHHAGPSRGASGGRTDVVTLIPQQSFAIGHRRSRRLVHVGVTEHPTAVWSAQRLVEAVADTDQVPRFLVHDRDSIFGGAFRQRIRGLGVRLLKTPPRSPRSNVFCERVIGTIRRGCTDHVLFRDERHAGRVIRQYVAYYHGRPHRSLHMQPPDAARHLMPSRPPPGTRIIASPVLGGLHHRYGFSQRPEAPRPTATAA